MDIKNLIITNMVVLETLKVQTFDFLQLFISMYWHRFFVFLYSLELVLILLPKISI